MSEVASRCYILAGGASRRFGSDKARARVGGVMLIERVAAVAADVGAEVTVVAAHDDQYADLGLRTIGDVGRQRGQQGAGPLAGIATGLRDAGIAGAVRALFLTCDRPGLRPAWLSQLLAVSGPRPVVFASEQRIEPFPSVFPVGLLPTIEQAARGDDRSVTALLTGRATTIGLPPRWAAAPDINTVRALKGVPE